MTSILMKLAAVSHLAGKQLVLPRRLPTANRRALATRVTANVTKSDLIAVVAEKSKLSGKDAQSAVNVLLETIVSNVAKGEKVVIPGFGTFEQRVRAARKGRNPRTGEELQIPESKSPAFSAGKTFKDSVKSGKLPSK